MINSNVKAAGVCIGDAGEKGVSKGGRRRQWLPRNLFFNYTIRYKWIYNLIVDRIFENQLR